MAQYFHLDDSGDPGMDRAAGSSNHFTLAMVQLPERAPIDVFAAVRETLYLPSSFEFHYYRSKPHQKVIFFNAIKRLRFRVRAVFINKYALEKAYQAMDGQQFAIEFLTRLILRASDLDIGNDVLVIDGATLAFMRALRIRLSQECRSYKRVRPFRKIVSGESKREDGLQLADMIAGAVSNHLLGEESAFYPMFADKVSDLWQAP